MECCIEVYIRGQSLRNRKRKEQICNGFRKIIKHANNLIFAFYKCEKNERLGTENAIVRREDRLFSSQADRIQIHIRYQFSKS